MDSQILDKMPDWYKRIYGLLKEVAPERPGELNNGRPGVDDKDVQQPEEKEMAGVASPADEAEGKHEPKVAE